MEPELISLAVNGGPAAIITAMILWFLKPVRAAAVGWLKSHTKEKE